MVKKAGVKKKVSQKKISIASPKIKKISSPKKNTEKILIDNFIALQKVNTNLAIKFDKLANQISSLLELFEVSAKSLAEKDFDVKKENRDNKQIIEKINNLLEQNRTIAKGVALIHENSENRPIYPPKRLTPQAPSPTQNTSDYKKSISEKRPQTMNFNEQKRG